MDGIDNRTEWRLLPYPGKRTYYYASNVGQILSWQTKVHVHALKVCKSNIVPGNEKRFAPYLKVNNAGCPIYSKSVHRLVASVFCPCPSLFHNQVDHIDGNPFNNNAANLRWVTQSENMRARYALKRGEIVISPLQKVMFHV